MDSQGITNRAIVVLAYHLLTPLFQVLLRRQKHLIHWYSWISQLWKVFCIMEVSYIFINNFPFIILFRLWCSLVYISADSQSNNTNTPVSDYNSMLLLRNDDHSQEDMAIAKSSFSQNTDPNNFVVAPFPKSVVCTVMPRDGKESIISETEVLLFIIFLDYLLCIFFYYCFYFRSHLINVLAPKLKLKWLNLMVSGTIIMLSKF